MLIFMCVLEAVQSIDPILLFEEDRIKESVKKTNFTYTTYTPNICIVFVMWISTAMRFDIIFFDDYKWSKALNAVVLFPQPPNAILRFYLLF